MNVARPEPVAFPREKRRSEPPSSETRISAPGEPRAVQVIVVLPTPDCFGTGFGAAAMRLFPTARAGVETVLLCRGVKIVALPGGGVALEHPPAMAASATSGKVNDGITALPRLMPVPTRLSTATSAAFNPIVPLGTRTNWVPVPSFEPLGA